MGFRSDEEMREYARQLITERDDATRAGNTGRVELINAELSNLGADTTAAPKCDRAEKRVEKPARKPAEKRGRAASETLTKD